MHLATAEVVARTLQLEVLSEFLEESNEFKRRGDNKKWIQSMIFLELIGRSLRF